jgi:hypothetical protein
LPLHVLVSWPSTYSGTTMTNFIIHT